jgi:thiosulfate/3-mercaptopyruvate sulfurtransferase
MTDPLISAQQLVELLSSPAAANRTVILDCRFEMAEVGLAWREFQELHVVGAHYAHLEDDLSGPITNISGRHPMPDRTKLQAWLGTQSITPSRTVVVYDDAGGAMAAARAWMLLKWIGHEDVRLLDGGLDAFLAIEGQADDRDSTHFPQPPYPDREPLLDVLDFQTVEHMVATDNGNKLLDARAPGRYTGDTVMLDARAGHIPGARNLPYTNTIQHGRIRPFEEMKDLFTDSDVHYCGSGVTSCVNVVAASCMGIERPMIYIGSWSEWSARSDLAETGLPGQAEALESASSLLGDVLRNDDDDDDDGEEITITGQL